MACSRADDGSRCTMAESAEDMQLGSSAPQGRFSRQIKCAENRLYDLRIGCDLRELRTQTIVENLAHQGTITEDSPCHGHRCGFALGKNTANYDFSQPRK